MVSQAEIIKNSIETNWALTGILNKASSANMKEIVRFFDRKQVRGNEWPKAVTVEKINAEANENRVVHPLFTEVSDRYTLTCLFRVTDSDPVAFSTSLTAVEDMGREVGRILALTFNPASITGDFFTTNSYWTKRDHIEGGQIDLVREMSFTLTKIISEVTTVFTGYGGVLTFDLSDSGNMDNPPGGDYIYTEANRIRLQEGFGTIPYLTKNITLGRGVPVLKREMFRGKFNSVIYAKKADLDGATADKLDNIYKMQANGQHIEATLLHANNSTEGTPSVLTQQTFIKVTSMEKLTDNENLVTYDVTGDLIKPSLYTVT